MRGDEGTEVEEVVWLTTPLLFSKEAEEREAPRGRIPLGLQVAATKWLEYPFPLHHGTSPEPGAAHTATHSDIFAL